MLRPHVEKLFVGRAVQVELEHARWMRRIFGEFGDQLVIFKKGAVKSVGQEYALTILQVPQRAAAALGYREPFAIGGKHSGSGSPQPALRQFERALHLAIGCAVQTHFAAVLLPSKESAHRRQRRYF